MSRHFHHFRDDPFFDYPRDIDSTFKNLESRFSYPAIEGSDSSCRNRDIVSRENHFGNFGNFFNDFNQQIQSMSEMMNKAFSSFDMDTINKDPNSSFYSASSVYEYRGDLNGGEPQVYQAHKSVRQGAGGVREEQKAVRDTHKAAEKMAIGRYINERGREVERRRDMKTGENEEHKRYHHMGESDSEEFDNQWDSLAKKSFHRNAANDRRREINAGNGATKDHRTKHDKLAIAEGKRYQH